MSENSETFFLLILNLETRPRLFFLSLNVETRPRLFFQSLHVDTRLRLMLEKDSSQGPSSKSPGIAAIPYMGAKTLVFSDMVPVIAAFLHEHRDCREPYHAPKEIKLYTFFSKYK